MHRHDKGHARYCSWSVLTTCATVYSCWVTSCFTTRTFALMCSKVQKLLMDKNAFGDSLLGTVARSGHPDNFSAMFACVEEHLTDKQVRKVFP